MKRITLALEDDALYRAVKMEAARQGRSVKDVVSEALERWLHFGSELPASALERRRQALQDAERLRGRLHFHSGDVSRDIEEMRLERP